MLPLPSWPRGQRARKSCTGPSEPFTPVRGSPLAAEPPRRPEAPVHGGRQPLFAKPPRKGPFPAGEFAPRVPSRPCPARLGEGRGASEKPAQASAAPARSPHSSSASKGPLPGLGAGPPPCRPRPPIYLKTSTPKRGRKLRLRDVLSSEMISPPLGDFRHSAHIGPAGRGDMFGELSFLQGRYDLLPSLSRRLASQSAQEVAQEFARGPAAPPPPAAASGGGYRALLKSAVSLPVFGGARGPEQAPPKPPRLHLEEVPGGQRSMSVSCAEGLSSPLPHYEQLSSSVSFSAASSEGSFPGTWGLGYGAGPGPEAAERSYCPGASVPRSESLLGLDLDLGPSILEDMLRIMEEYQLLGTKAL